MRQCSIHPQTGYVFFTSTNPTVFFDATAQVGMYFLSSWNAGIVLGSFASLHAQLIVTLKPSSCFLSNDFVPGKAFLLSSLSCSVTFHGFSQSRLQT